MKIIQTGRKKALLVVLGLFTATDSSASDFWQKSKMTGEFRNVLMQSSSTDAIREAGISNNVNSGSSGFSFKFNSASVSNFTFNTEIQAATDWKLHDETTGPSSRGGEDDRRATVTSLNLQQLYIDYQFDKSVSNSVLRFGRQEFKTPLVANSGFFPLKDSFDAIAFINKDLPDTSLQVFYLNKWNKRYGNDSVGTLVESDSDFDEPVYSIHFVNKSVKGLKVEGQWFVNDNGGVGDPPENVNNGSYSSGYIAADYKIPNSDFYFAGKYLTVDYDDSADSSYWGAKLGWQQKKYKAQISYTSVDDDNDFVGTLGHVPQFRQYKFGYTNEFFAGLDTIILSVNYDLGIQGLQTTFSYSMFSQSELGAINSNRNFDGANEFGLSVKYTPKKIKGLNVVAKVAQIEFDRDDVEDNDLAGLRLVVNYKFSINKH